MHVDAGAAGLHDIRVTNPPPASGAQRRPRVLIVEDDQAVLFALARRLERTGYEVVSATDLESALVLLCDVSTGRISAIILDLMLPDSSGLNILRLIRQGKGGSRIPVLVFTGAVLDEDSLEMIHDAHATVFYKPEHLGKLVQHLDEITGRGPTS